MRVISVISLFSLAFMQISEQLKQELGRVLSENRALIGV